MKLSNYFWEPLKFAHTNIWFWSDLHIGHKCESWDMPLWKNRGFESIDEHDQTLIDRWNNNIKLDSIVFHLGDIMFGYGGEQRLFNLISNLKFNKLFLLGGNHHAGFKQLLDKSDVHNGVSCMLINDNKQIYFVPNYLEIMICGQPIVLSHYPIASWNGQSKGSWMIHGHCHANLYKSDIGKILYKCKIIDVGVENCSEPISMSGIRNIFKQKENLTFDHHNSETNNSF
jgi:calcineurin-like phosphoesterase family protein